MFNWFSQVASVVKFGLLSIPQRRGSVGAALFGIVGVVGVLIGVLSMAVGFKRTMAASSSPDAAIVLRSGANDEMSSGLQRDETRLLAEAPGVARGPEGPLASAELFVIINLPKRSTGTDANVPLRGVEPAAFNVREKFKLLQGRRFERGKNEVIVGTGAAQEFSRLAAARRNRSFGPMRTSCKLPIIAATAFSRSMPDSRRRTRSFSSAIRSRAIRA
jgi:putative ABC transport system permease protein